MTFDYELCMKRDGGKALWRDVPVRILGSGNRIGVDSYYWYPCVDDSGRHIAVPTRELRNLDPPKPELKPVDVAWRKTPGQAEACLTVVDGKPFYEELRRITVDPNVLTPDELAGFDIQLCPTRYCCGEITTWCYHKPGVFTSDEYPTHAEACRAATEYLRKEGKIK